MDRPIVLDQNGRLALWRLDQAVGPKLLAIYAQQALIKEQSKQPKRLWPKEGAEALLMPKPIQQKRIRYQRATVAEQMSALPAETCDGTR